MKNIGFIGLGIMGKPMVLNLLKSGYKVKAFDLIDENIKEVVNHGAIGTKSLAEVAKESEVIISMLPNSPQVLDVINGENGILEHLEPNTYWVDMTTGAPKDARLIEKILFQKGVKFFDGPVSGGEVGAINGTLSIMLGGDEKDLPKLQPIFDAVGKKVNFLGPVGSGQAAKMCNQIICAMNLHAIAEAFALGEAEGLDLRVLTEVISGGAANSWMLENFSEKIIAKDDNPGFKIDLQVKDLKIAIDSAFDKKVPVPGAMLSTSLYVEAQAHNQGDRGNHSLFLVYDRLANLKK